MPPLPLPPRQPEPPESPEELFGRLQVRDPALDNLWSQQADVLRAYARDHRQTPDVALELPTGSGKTLVGLLISEWRRLRLGERVAFLCPNNQLAHQVHEKSAGYGIDTVLLIEGSDSWPAADVGRFNRNDAVAITNYNHVFNRTPRINAQTLVMDDAHTAEGPVADRWSLSISRDRLRDGYFALLTAISQELPEHHLRALRSDDLDPARRGAVEVVLPHAVSQRAGSLAQAIEEHVEGRDEWYGWDAIAESLGTCLVYASWGQILVRPFIAPAFAQDAFVRAGQRVYLSATLGAGGELERSVGRGRIHRIPQPADWDIEGSGRRYMMAPGAGRDAAEANELIREVVDKVGRVLVLAPSEWRLNQLPAVLLPAEMPQLRRWDIEESLESFTSAERSALLLANRYDGIDLPHDACRLIVLSGLPSGTHLQERFLFGELGARHVLAERIRTRITQGAGRATRGRRDTAIVVFHADDLIGFVSQSEVREVLRSELQAELELALSSSALPRDQLRESVDSFLSQDADWSSSEEWLRATAQERPRQMGPATEVLATSAEHEITAWQEAWRGHFAAAVAAAQQAVAALNNPATANYRAWWLSLAASWSILDAGEESPRTVELIREASMSSRKMRWRPSLPTQMPAITVDEAVALRAELAAAWLRRRVRSPKLERDLTTLEAQISATSSVEFELGLEQLGELLGFEAERPAETSDPDGAWRDGAAVWLLFEAKSEETSDGEISAEELRQANSHENWIRHHYVWPEPERAATLLVTPRERLHRDAHGVADDSLYRVSPALIREIAAQVVTVIREAAAEMVGLSDDELRDWLAAAFVASRLRTPDLLERLTAEPLVDA